MRVIFMGTPDFAVPALNAIVAAEHVVVAVYSQPPRPAGRGKKLSPSPVHLRAEELEIQIQNPASLKSKEEQVAFAALGADVAVVAAYGLILPLAILDTPKHGCLNIHGSLLPRWRGAAPIQRAILAGDDETGICIMQMEAGLDTGPVRLAAATKIENKTAGELAEAMAAMGAQMVVKVLNELAAFPPEPQPDIGVTYAAKIDKAETRIDFSHSAEAVLRQIRAFNPTPCAWFEYGGERYRILAADLINSGGGTGTVLDNQLTIACADGAIRPSIIQRAGKPAMTAAELLRGKKFEVGTVLV
jgi:methionyl-tRNA formyltransferase